MQNNGSNGNNGNNGEQGLGNFRSTRVARPSNNPPLDNNNVADDFFERKRRALPSLNGAGAGSGGDGAGAGGSGGGEYPRNVRQRSDGSSGGAVASSGESRAGDGGGATPPSTGAGGFGGVPNGAGGGATPPGVVAVAGDVAGAVTNQVPAPVTPPAHIFPLGNEYLNATPGTREM
jgi:hypothetical protein